MKKMQNYTTYVQRNTQINWLNKSYRLSCEYGKFILYSMSGEVIARSCKYPFSGKDSIRPIQGLTKENKFLIKEHIPGIIALVDINNNCIQDFLVKDTNLIDKALYMYICQALVYQGYSANSEPKMKLNQQGLSVILGFNDVEIEVRQGSVIYAGNLESKYVKHTFSILKDLGVSQFSKLILV